jgi:hypothetical protein
MKLPAHIFVVKRGAAIYVGQQSSACVSHFKEICVKFRKYYFVLLAIFANMVMQSANATTGGYGTSTALPTIYSKNFWYSSALPVVGTPPSNATVTVVYYTFNYPFPRPAGLLVYLCNNNGTLCADVTSIANGNVNFTGYNVPANQPLKFYVSVQGSGTMSPYGGSQATASVNYTY